VIGQHLEQDTPEFDALEDFDNIFNEILFDYGTPIDNFEGQHARSDDVPAYLTDPSFDEALPGPFEGSYAEYAEFLEKTIRDTMYDVEWLIHIGSQHTQQLQAELQKLKEELRQLDQDCQLLSLYPDLSSENFELLPVNLENGEEKAEPVDDIEVILTKPEIEENAKEDDSDSCDEWEDALDSVNSNLVKTGQGDNTQNVDISHTPTRTETVAVKHNLEEPLHISDLTQPFPSPAPSADISPAKSETTIVKPTSEKRHISILKHRSDSPATLPTPESSPAHAAVATAKHSLEEKPHVSDFKIPSPSLETPPNVQNSPTQISSSRTETTIVKNNLERPHISDSEPSRSPILHEPPRISTSQPEVTAVKHNSNQSQVSDFERFSRLRVTRPTQQVLPAPTNITTFKPTLEQSRVSSLAHPSGSPVLLQYPQIQPTHTGVTTVKTSLEVPRISRSKQPSRSPVFLQPQRISSSRPNATTVQRNLGQSQVSDFRHPSQSPITPQILPAPTNNIITTVKETLKQPQVSSSEHPRSSPVLLQTPQIPSTEILESWIEDDDVMDTSEDYFTPRQELDESTAVFDNFVHDMRAAIAAVEQELADRMEICEPEKPETERPNVIDTMEIDNNTPTIKKNTLTARKRTSKVNRLAQNVLHKVQPYTFLTKQFYIGGNR
jgi:hypothetical protein